MQNKQALFLIGSPGSGKDVVIRDITSNYGIVEFTSTQIDEMLSNDAAFKRAKPEKQDSLLERYSIIVTGNSFDLGFVMTRELLESIGYSTHLILVEADLSVAVDRLKTRKNLKESLDRISVGNSNKQSIIGLFESGIIVNNSERLNLSEVREFVSSILRELSFKSDLSLDEITKIDLKKKVQKVVPLKLPGTASDTRGVTPGTWSTTFGGVTESVDVPSYDISPIATGPLQNLNTNTVSMQSDQDKENTRKLLGKIKRINFKKQVVPRGI
jgi:dephospho-CoA kinase